MREREKYLESLYELIEEMVEEGYFYEVEAEAFRAIESALAKIQSTYSHEEEQ